MLLKPLAYKVLTDHAPEQMVLDSTFHNNITLFSSALRKLCTSGVHKEPDKTLLAIALAIKT